MNPEHSNPGPDRSPAEPSQLDWLAFRYVSGDMDDQEQAHWEDRLAVDQAAREAVASSVEWIQAAGCLSATDWNADPSESAAQRQPAAGGPVRPADANRSARRWQPLAWMAAGAAAAALVATQLPWFKPPAVLPPIDRSAARNGDASSELALMWSQTRQDSELADDAATDSDMDDWASASDDERSAIATPSWLNAAMIGLAEVDSSSTPDLNSPPTKGL